MLNILTTASVQEKKLNLILFEGAPIEGANSRTTAPILCLFVLNLMHFYVESKYGNGNLKFQKQTNNGKCSLVICN